MKTIESSVATKIDKTIKNIGKTFWLRLQL